MAGKARHMVLGGALLSALTIVGSACSSSGSTPKSSSDSTPTTTANVALLGPAKAATGAPLKIGYIYAGQTQSLDTRPELAIAQATVKYINEHLGGVAGRPLELLPCTDNFSPANATDCANQMIAAKVPVVLSAQPSEPAAVMKVLEPAKIPFFIWSGVDQSVFLSPDGYALGNPLILLAAPIKLAKQDGTKKVAMVYIDLPAAGALTSIGGPLYTKAGLSLLATAVPPGTPDMTPQIQAALSRGAQKFLVVGDTGFCISALKALKTLAFTGQTVINSACFSPDVAKAVPGGVDGLKVATIDALDPKDREVALYEAVAAKYAPGTPPHAGGNSGGYAVVLGFARAMTALSASNVTPSGIAAALKSMAPQPMPLLSGQTFTCDRKLAPLTPAVCSNGAALVTLGASGNVKQIEGFDAAPYLKLG
jgi:branched-chain amino acid transport system substrate-binding protein